MRRHSAFSPIFLCALVFLYAGPEETAFGDEITGGFRFVSPAMGSEKRWTVEGDEARFGPGDEVEISPVRAVVYEGKEPDYLFRAPWARFDRKTRDIWTDAPVEITRGSSKMTGIGLRWKTSEKKATILSHVKMSMDMSEAREWQENP